MSPLANQDPLAQLNDIIAPSAPHWFPPAPIYWLLLIVGCALIAVIYRFLKKQRKQQKRLKSQLSKLTYLQQNEASFVELNQLLKGCALSHYSRLDVASLHGEQWFDFLQRHSHTPIFESKATFVQRLYQLDVQAVDESDYKAAKKWITHLPKQIKKVQKDV